ncbi:DNA-directed RNA polymerase I subunit RPA49 [Elysia marginata]|uniref:DNA-directed RNA polymerase I subunit RPA49 n=1 Tax=Elysia marginata TaxID=1093978 RepID=A0AAV4JZ70_9GAST|nr:DNA-directed RNA polymerase I subunit RPA49 [Elysia marginata]
MPEFEVDTDASPVTLVRFSNGTTKNKVAVKCYTKEETRDGKSFQQQILTSQVDDRCYVGRNFGPTNRFPTDSSDYYVGIHDKSTGKIRVVPASLVQMDPWFKEKEKDNNLETAKTFKEKNDALTTEFGSGRSKRAVMKRLKEGLSQEMMASSAETAVKTEDAETLASSSTELKMQSEAIPPYNMDAATPDDVYFSYILDKVEILSEVPEARLLQGQCLMYLQYLMEFYMMKSHQIRLKYPLPKDWPITVRDHLLNNFTLEMKEPGERSKRCVPGRLKDLTLSHILVLCLKMSEFCLDISPLMTDLKLSAKKLSIHASALGCSTKKSKQGLREVHTVILKLPLTFPNLKGKAKKNKIF